jgi:hypothetical protein
MKPVLVDEQCCTNMTPQNLLKGEYSMANKNKSVFGIYPSRSAVENGVSALKTSGFQHSDVSILLPENLGSRKSRPRRTPRLQKAPQPVLARER